MNDDVVWLTYDELAERLGIERESARTLVKRKRWGRRPGNDGKVRIAVPEDVVPQDAPRIDPPADPVPVQVHEPAQPPAPIPDHVPGVIDVLTRHVERLEQQLDAALSRASDRDAIATERDIVTAQVEGLRAALAAAERDRDRWHKAATQVPEPPPFRPWWRRIAG